MSNSTSVDQPLIDLELAGRGRNNLLHLDDGTHHRGDALRYKRDSELVVRMYGWSCVGWQPLIKSYSEWMPTEHTFSSISGLLKLEVAIQ
jgi:hypothetical protein